MKHLTNNNLIIWVYLNRVMFDVVFFVYLNEYYEQMQLKIIEIIDSISNWIECLN